MESPFINFPVPEMETYNRKNEMYDDIMLKSPFLNLEERESGLEDEMEWEDEEMVDEEEMEFDFHESEEEGEYANDGEFGATEIEDRGSERFYEEEEDTSGILSTVEALPVPERNPVPFAPLPAPGSFWPIITTHSKGREVAFQGIDKKYTGNVGRRFLAPRTDGVRYHAGVDLWANDKDPIVACEDGVIVNFYHFYRSTYALLVEHKNIVINYGEVHEDSLKVNNLKKGDKVKAGQRIGIVGKMYSSSMLHFETYKKGTRSNKRFKVGTPAPKELLNPTKYLLFLQRHGLNGMGGTTKYSTVPDASAVSTKDVSTPSQTLPAGTSADSVVSRILQHTGVIEQYSSTYNINPNLIRGIIAAESGGNHLSGKGSSGYKGLMQAERTTDQLQPDVSVKTGIEKFIKFRDKILNPWLIKLGITRPAENNENYLKACLSCYNAGPVTALKAIQYAHAAGDWQQWLSPANYLRALVFSGGYDRYSACTREAKSTEIERAKAERLKYRFKTSGWRSEPDPAPWNSLVSVINTIMRCWIETKFKNTPGYLEKFIRYFKYFESNPVAHELEDAVEHEDQDQFYPGELYEEESMDEEEIVDDEETADEEEMEWEDETEDEENFNELVMQEVEGNEEEVDEEYDEYEGIEDFDPEEKLSYETAENEDEASIDQEEWEEDWLETARAEQELASLESETEWESDIAYSQSEVPGSIGNLVSTTIFTNWHNSVVGLKKKFPNEPQHNIDQLPIPPWINPDSFYQDFIQKHGGDARTIIGDASKKVQARYFVLHDTAVAADFTQSRIKGKRIHLWVNAKSPVLLGNDWHVKGLGVKLERRRNNSFVHIEITREEELQKAVQQKTKGKKVSYEEIIKQGGIKNFGTYYTDKQYELVAYAYLVASIRKGKFLTVTIHREVDRSVVVKRQNGQYGYGHDDPQFFDLDYFYSVISRMLKIPVKVAFGIQNERALAHKQGNMAGYVNEFIPFVTGDAEAANQYGELIRLNPQATKYKVVKLKHGNYYDVTHLKNQLQQAEANEEIALEVPRFFSPGSGAGSSSGAASIPVPSFIAEDLTVPGYTCYVRIDIGKANYPMTMTGIYIPAIFDPKQPVDVVLYLHGMTGTFPGTCAQIIDYWSISELPKYDLRIREEINASSRNIILVAPSLGDSPNKYRNNLSGKKQGLDNYLENVLVAVNSYIIKKRFNSNPINFRNIILAAHSAGGMQMLKIATSDNPIYGPKILECWGFDSLYGRVVDLWLSWAAKNKDKKLMIYYQSSTEGNTTLLERKSKKHLNVFIKKSPAKNHYWVPKEHLKDRVMKIGRADLTKTDFEESSMSEHEHFLNETDELVKDWSTAIRLNRSYANKLGWNQFFDQINDLLLPFSGQQNVSLSEEAFVQAVTAWQQQQGFSAKDADGAIGPKTWARMKSLLNLRNDTQPQHPVIIQSPGGSSAAASGTGTMPQGPFGKLKINITISALSKSHPQYQFTPEDALWLARFVEGEAGGEDNADSHAVIWAMFNRFGMLRHRVSRWTSFATFLRLYSTTLQPLLKNVNAAKRVWYYNKTDPVKYAIVSSEETYPKTNVKKVQYLRHIKLQNKAWNDFAPYVRNMVTRILSGQIPNPGIGIATHFLSTDILLKTKRKEQGITEKPTYEEWRQSTLQYAQKKNRVWIGETPNINQRKNAFFIQPRLKNVPPDAVKVQMEYGHELSDYSLPYESEYNEGIQDVEWEENDNELEIDEEWDEDELKELYNQEAEMDELVKDSSTAIRLNLSYANKLGWNQYYDQINTLLLPFSGYQKVSLGEEAFAQAVAAWQQKQGFSAKDSDGIIGPNSWRIMQPIIIVGKISQPALNTTTSSTTSSIEQTEWANNPNINARYQNWQAYKKIRDQVAGWGDNNPGIYIETAIQEWKTNTAIHRHFRRNDDDDPNFDDDPHRSFLNLKRLYQEEKGIANPAAYFAANLVSISFFNRKTTGHRNLGIALNTAQSNLIAAGHYFNLIKAGSFVPRTLNDNINKLSNHALGKAVDINSDNNPHITSKEEILVIDRVCNTILPGGLLSESDPDILRRASVHFRATFNDAWINQQTQTSVLNAIWNKRKRLDQFASNGFLNLSSILIRALQQVGLTWGGAWRRSKDFMHFELP